MTWHFTIYAALYLASAAVAASVAAYAWRRREARGARSLSALMVSATIFAGLGGVEAAAVGQPAKVFWSVIQYFGITTSPVLFLIFALDYASHDRWLTPRYVVLMMIVPALTIMMAATNELHHLNWSSFTPSPNGENLLVYHYGPWLWFAVVYFYSVVMIGTIALVRAIRRSTHVYRRHALLILAGACLPWLGSILYVFQIDPIEGFDTTPIGFALAGVLLAWGMYEYRLLDLVPIARHVLIEHLTDGVVVIDARRRIVDINPAAQIILDRAAPPIGQSIDSVFAAWPDLLARFRDVLETQAEVIINDRYFDLTIVPLHGRRGRRTGHLITARDVTERKRLLEQIQRHADELEQRVTDRTAELDRERIRLQAILDSAGDGIYFMDDDLTIRYINPALERLTGYASAEVLGQTPWVWTSDTSDPVWNEVRQHLARREIWQGEMIHRRKDGTFFDAAVTISPLQDSRGFVAVQRDISHLKELDRLRNQFVTRIGHELRTPLTSIMVYLELLKYGKPDKHEYYLTTLNHEADRLRRLIDGFLRIATLDAGREPIRKLPTRLNDLIAGIVTNRREAAASRGIALASTLDPALPEAMTDAELTTEAIRYLLDNALNYTPHGGHVTIAAALASNAGTDWVTIRISDSGPGIAPDEMPRLFERFYRGAAARDYKTPGVGLSLAICKAIAERVGGRITVESQVGQGASFTLWLKRA